MQQNKPRKGVVLRTLRMLFKTYPVLAPIVTFGLIFSSVVSSVPALFQQRIIAVIEKWVDTGNWPAAKAEIMPLIAFLIVLYVLSICLMIAGQLILAYMTQGFLCRMRRTMFDHMQDLPIRYFDTHRAGDVMSYYTNDIDTLRQLVSQALPQIVRSGTVLLTVLSIMVWYCGWLTLLILCGVVAMILVTRKFGGGSARYFKQQQKTMGKTEGFIQEMMNGQKVVKVFCREEESKAAFDKLNDELCEDSFHANAYANTL
jgi:ATP-binding cassette subfamily B protein